MCGCTVYAHPPGYYHRYYYRTRVVYTPSGPVYVRERVYDDEPVAEGPTYAPPPSASVTPSAVPVEFSAAEALHPLVAPIALYPDPLVAEILPASTYPQQIQDAQAWLSSRPQPSQEEIDVQPWAPSVKALMHYPTVLAQLARDIPWTTSLGSAYLNQSADVMAAIQQMRAQALAEGNLRDTPQQVIVQDGPTIAIEPATPDLIYVPRYDPVLVYESPYPIAYSVMAYPVGPWLTFGCYWDGGAIIVGDWHGGYYYRGGRWGRDYAWRTERGHYWARDSRWGPPPRVERDRYIMARDLRGREGELHRSMREHAEQRRELERRGSAGRGGERR